MTGVIASVALQLDAKQPNQQLKGVTQQSRKTEKAVESLNGRMRDASGRFVKSGAAAKKAGIGTRFIGVSAKGAVPGVAALGGALKATLGPIAAITSAAGALTALFSTLSKQDFAEAKFRSLGGSSEELKGRLQDVSRELSGQASVVELTGAAYDVASAGFSNAADAAEILKAASLGATGGFSDINTVGDAATSVLNAYGLEADKAGKLVDGFIQTQNDGKIVIGEYAANIAKVAPVAASLGVPLEEVNAAVAQITAGGQGAEVTFTALKTAFAQVAAGKVGKEFEALGVEINASTLKSDGLAGTLEKIKKSGADAGTVIKAFGTEAGPSILALLNNTEKYNKLLENQKESQGAAAKAAFTASDTIQGQLKRLQTAFENLFTDQSELGVLLKETFKVAAVTVEVFAVALKSALVPVRFLFAIVKQIGSAISQAIGVDGTDAAFNLEQGFQSVLKTIQTVQSFVIGLGARIGQVLGKVFAFIASAGKSVAQGLVGVFAGLFSKITQIIQGAYNLIPAPIRDFIEGKIKGAVSRIQSFAQGTIDLGRGFTDGLASLGTPSASDAANDINKTGGLLGKGKTKKTKTDKNKEAEQAKKIAEASAKRVQALQDQTLLASALTAEERVQFERQIELRKLLENKGNLSKEQLDAEVAATLELHNQVDATNLQTQAIKDRAKAAKEAQEAEEAAGKKLSDLYTSIGDSIKTGVVDALSAAVDGTKSLAEVASNVLKNIANILLKFGIDSVFSGLGSGGGFLGKLFGGGRANGGPVSPNRSFLVGERGPELFVPRSSGNIVPNQAMGGANVTVNVDASGSQVQGDDSSALQLGKVIGAAVQSELIKQKRPGGLLAT